MHVRACLTSELANTVDRVVVVGGDEKRATGSEGEGLTHEPARSRCIRSQDDGVFVRVGTNEVEQCGARVRQVACRGARGSVFAVWIAQYRSPEALGIGAYQRGRVERRSRIVEVR